MLLNLWLSQTLVICMQRFIRRRRSRWPAAQWQERIPVNSPDHGLVDEEDTQEDVAVSMQFSSHQVRATKHKDQILNQLQQVNNKDKNSIPRWDTINATAAKDMDILPMYAHRLNKEIIVVDVVVDEICVEEPQEDVEVEEEICSEDEDEQRQ